MIIKLDKSYLCPNCNKMITLIGNGDIKCYKGVDENDILFCIDNREPYWTHEDPACAVDNILKVRCFDCDELMVPIDIHIADAVSLLNEKGYKTKFCCSSHAGTMDASFMCCELFDREAANTHAAYIMTNAIAIGTHQNIVHTLETFGKLNIIEKTEDGVYYKYYYVRVNRKNGLPMFLNYTFSSHRYREIDSQYLFFPGVSYVEFSVVWQDRLDIDPYGQEVEDEIIEANKLLMEFIQRI